MAVADAVLLKKPLVVPGGHDRLAALEPQRQLDIRRILRILDADAPVASVRLRADGLNARAEGENAADAGVLHFFAAEIGREALGDGAEVELHAVGECDDVARDRNLVQADRPAQGGELRFVRYPVFPGRKAPGEGGVVEADIEGATGLIGDGRGAGDDLRKVCVFRLPDLIERVERASGFRGGELVIQLAQKPGHFLQKAVVRGVNPQVHHGVHGKDGLLAERLRRGAAGGSQQQQRKQERGGSFHRFHLSCEWNQAPCGA